MTNYPEHVRVETKSLEIKKQQAQGNYCQGRHSDVDNYCDDKEDCIDVRLKQTSTEVTTIANFYPIDQVKSNSKMIPSLGYLMRRIIGIQISNTRNIIIFPNSGFNIYGILTFTLKIQTQQKMLKEGRKPHSTHILSHPLCLYPAAPPISPHPSHKCYSGSPCQKVSLYFALCHTSLTLINLNSELLLAAQTI